MGSLLAAFTLLAVGRVEFFSTFKRVSCPGMHLKRWVMCAEPLGPVLSTARVHLTVLQSCIRNHSKEDTARNIQLLQLNMMGAWSPPEMQPGGQASWEESVFKRVILHLCNPDVQQACDETSGLYFLLESFQQLMRRQHWRELLDLVKSSTPSGWRGARVEHIIRPPNARKTRAEL